MYFYNNNSVCVRKCIYIYAYYVVVLLIVLYRDK